MTNKKTPAIGVLLSPPNRHVATAVRRTSGANGAVRRCGAEG